MTNSINQSNKRADLLAKRLLKGASQLAAFTGNLSENDWHKPVLGDGRSIGVVVHHVASVYPIEIELAKVIATGKPITEVTWDAINHMNAGHASENDRPDRDKTLELLKNNSEKAADALREFTDDELDTAVNVSLYYDAPLTAQFFIEDHALRHSYHHLGKIKDSL